MTTVVFHDALTWTTQSRMHGMEPLRVLQVATFALYLRYPGGRMILRAQSLIMAEMINLAHKEHLGNPVEGWLLRIWSETGRLMLPSDIQDDEAKPNLVALIDFNAEP